MTYLVVFVVDRSSKYIRVACYVFFLVCLKLLFTGNTPYKRANILLIFRGHSLLYR